jgi:D-alanyl-D-alanine carboxypeptidase
VTKVYSGSLPTPIASVPLSRRALLAGSLVLATAAAEPRPARSVRSQMATPVPPSEEAFPAEVQLQLTQVVETALAETSTPGALVGVWFPGRGTWTMAAGIGDLPTAAPMSFADHVRIASITKTFTATVVLQLVEEGTLSLDDRLGHFITGIPNGDGITIRQLLSMSAGVYNYIHDPLIAVDYVADPLLPFTPEQVVDIVRAYGEADFPPDAEVRYSDSNYVLLGLIIEQVTGRSVAAEITDRIILPLGLTGTSYPDTPEMPAPYARGYLGEQPGDPLRDVTRSNPAVAAAAGAMISTVADLKTWAAALATGALLSPALQAERLAVRPFAQSLAVSYGLGVLDAYGFLGHSGGIFGYSSWMLYDPDTRATLVIVTTRASTEGGTADPILAGILHLLFPGRLPDIPGPDVVAPDSATPVATPMA